MKMMTPEELKSALEKHGKWLKGEAEGREADLAGVDLAEADLAWANLARANLTWANLTEANLVGANLTEANLVGANLTEADLAGANLAWVNLTRANLTEANLARANLTRANLTEANLARANLTEANLARADLAGVNLAEADLTRANLPSPTMLLLAYWGEVSDPLCVELMRYDAANHPNPAAFDEWAQTWKCPYDERSQFQRAANFMQKRELWSPGTAKSALELVMMLFKEKGVKV